MIRQHYTEGAFVSIKLNDKIFGFGRLLMNNSIGFYDFFSPYENEANALFNKDYLFVATVYNDAVSKGRWLKIGKAPLKNNQLLENKYIQESIDPSKFSIYNPNNGIIVAASVDECKGLNRSVIFEPEDIEEVLLEYYEVGKLTRWELYNEMDNF